MTTCPLLVAMMTTGDVDSPPLLTWKNVGEVAVRLKGRVLGSLVREDMTMEQVEQILGRPGRFPSTLCTGACSLCWAHYEALGLTVMYCSSWLLLFVWVHWKHQGFG